MDILKKKEGKYFVLDSTDENKIALKKTQNIWMALNDGKEGKYGKDFIKIKFDTDNNLPLNSPLKLRMVTIIVRSAFEEDGKFYPQVCLDECLYEL